MKRETSLSLLKQITAVVLILISLLAVACGTLEVGIERTATATVADPVTENAPLSARATAAVAKPASPLTTAIDVEVLVDRVNRDPTARTVVVLPADHAATLEGRPHTRQSTLDQ